MTDPKDLLEIPGFLRRRLEPPTGEPLSKGTPWVHPPSWRAPTPKHHRLTADLRAGLEKLGWTAHYRKGLTFERAMTILRKQESAPRKRRSLR